MERIMNYVKLNWSKLLVAMFVFSLLMNFAAFTAEAEAVCIWVGSYWVCF